MNRGRKYKCVYLHSLGCHNKQDCKPAKGQALDGIALKTTMMLKERASREHQGLEQTVTSQPLCKLCAGSFTWTLISHVQEMRSDLEFCRTVEDQVGIRASED